MLAAAAVSNCNNPCPELVARLSTEHARAIRTYTTQRRVQWGVGAYRSLKALPDLVSGTAVAWPRLAWGSAGELPELFAQADTGQAGNTMAKDGGFYGCVEDYVKERGGNRPIKKVSGCCCVLCEVSVLWCTTVTAVQQLAALI